MNEYRDDSGSVGKIQSLCELRTVEQPTYKRILSISIALIGLWWTGCSNSDTPLHQSPPGVEKSPTSAASVAPDVSQTYKVDDVRVLWMTLKVDEEDSLLIVLGRDGLVNRQGTGIAGETETLLYIGSHPKVFERVLESVDEEILQYMGTYKAKERKGAHCRLAVNFEFSDKISKGFVWEYGLESQGPPQELTKIVIEAIETTEPFYQAALKKQLSDKK